MPIYNTPVTRSAPVLSTWRNIQYPLSVVQALPSSNSDKGSILTRFCAKRDDGCLCAGTSDAAYAGVLIPHREAVHACSHHYRYANRSLLRFKSAIREDYAADLTFEIDAHGPVPELVDLSWYNPSIRSATSVGRIILDHLIGDLRVHPGWITTCVTRMGVSITVDWRAFGPKRLWQLMLIVKAIEAQLFDEMPLVNYAEKGMSLEIDTRIYDTCDTSRPGKLLTGRWIRPPGSLHDKSTHAVGWFRKTPVPHSEFRVDNALSLTLGSRGRCPDPDTWHFAEFHQPSVLYRWPELRWPGADHLVEGILPLAAGLVALFEDDTLIERLPDAARREVTRVRDAARPTIARAQEPHDVTLTINEEVVTNVVKALGLKHRDKGDRYILECPRGCKPGFFKAAIFKSSGAFSCFICGAASLATIARERGLIQLIPVRRQSSTGFSRRLLEDVEYAEPGSRWPGCNIIRREFDSLRAARMDQSAAIEAFLKPDNPSRVLVLLSPPGVGKTTAVANAVLSKGLRLRAFALRDDNKSDIAALLPGARVLVGRRSHTNCWNEDLVEAVSRKEPIGEGVCAGCQEAKRCRQEGYLAQFKELPHACHIVVQHMTSPHAELKMFDNGADVDFIDEDILDAAIEIVDWSPKELQLLRTGLTIDRGGLNENGEISLGSECLGPLVVRRGKTRNVECLIEGLLRRLTTDSIKSVDPDLVTQGIVTDLALARVLFADRLLVEAVAEITDAEIESVYDLGSLESWGTTLSDDYPSDAARRPMRRLSELLNGLYGLYRMHKSGQSELSSLQALKEMDGTWTLRLAMRRPLPLTASKIIIASASTTYERLRLAIAPPSEKAPWTVYRARPPQNERWTIVADSSYSKTSLLTAKGADEKRARLFETATKLLEVERARTNMPVAVIGPSEVVNAFNESALGSLPNRLRMPFRRDREQKMADLRALTEPLGYVTGYAFGIAGTNAFHVDDEGETRFLRSLIILGIAVPDLREFAARYRAVHAELPEELTHYSPPAFDWRFARRTIPVKGTEDADTVITLNNVPGYADAVANAILSGAFEGEVLQIAGRLRSFIPDPRDPSLEPRVWQFGAVVPPSIRVAAVLGQEELRQRLGLSVEEKRQRGRPRRLSQPDAIRLAVRKFGRRKALRMLATAICRELVGAKVGNDVGIAILTSRVAFSAAGFEFQDGDIRIIREVFASRK